jgi:hypothetical protein
MSSDPHSPWPEPPAETFETDGDDAPPVPWRFRETARTRIARGTRMSPWHDLVIADAVPPPRTWRTRLNAVWAPVAQWGRRLGDRAQGFQERRFQRQEGRPSFRAQEEWLDYYQSLYHGHDPDPARYVQLLRRNGVPDWPNPHTEGDLAHYDFHPDGLLAADLEAILLGLRRDWAREAPETPHEAANRRAACVCWALVVAKGQPLPHTQGRIHPSNLTLATVEAAASADLAQVGLTLPQVLTAAERLGILGAQERDQVQRLIEALRQPGKAPAVAP